MEWQWTGGAYPEREGITATTGPEGVTIAAWYDGGCGLEGELLIPWDSLLEAHAREGA